MRKYKYLIVSGFLVTIALLVSCKTQKPSYPNIILCMSDDQGWGDIGYHNHPFLKTPNLDKMAANGIKLERFYSAAPVCSPTRGSCLTGRHPYRYGIFNANVGSLPKEELTLAEVLKSLGYKTGHFGKWHLGTLTKTLTESNRGGERGIMHYSPPWENGFDECFSTEAKTPTYDPMIKPANWNDHRWWNPVKEDEEKKSFNTFYWTGQDQFVEDNLKGDDSKLIMDKALSFIKNAVNNKDNFFAVIWFHTPHWPVVAGEEYRDLYSGHDEFSQNHFGSISAMDDQIGRLRKSLKEIDVSNNTMLWFCSDNGPAGLVSKDVGKRHGKGSAGILRGRKKDLFEGGIRVPGILEWPKHIKAGQLSKFPCSTSDYFPTIMDILDYSHPNQPTQLDGISLLPMLNGQTADRTIPIKFQSGKKLALIDDKYKIISVDKGNSFMMYDLKKDPGEQTDIKSDHPELFEKMKEELSAWQKSCNKSLQGKDYIIH
ncbi:MAG: sulfatase-like hydrolase/transferase [Bacteroidota bacterium]